LFNSCDRDKRPRAKTDPWSTWVRAGPEAHDWQAVSGVRGLFKGDIEDLEASGLGQDHELPLRAEASRLRVLFGPKVPGEREVLPS
jgi:hypothetical protein